MNKNTKRFLKKFKFIRKMHQELIGQYLEERQIGVNIDEITPLKAKQAGADFEKKSSVWRYQYSYQVL